MTRYRHDINKMVENNEISTGPGRWALGVPNAYGNAAYIPEPTIRMQKWGAAHDMSSTKTDVESDLRNLARPSVRVACGSYSPNDAGRTLTAMPETSFPETHARLVDPPCTLRGTGWNRWEWLCQNPQENVMMPFEWAVDSRQSNKDMFRPQIGAVSGHPIPDAVPVPRQPRRGDAPDFSNLIPGASQRAGPPSYVEVSTATKGAPFNTGQAATTLGIHAPPVSALST